MIRPQGHPRSATQINGTRAPGPSHFFGGGLHNMPAFSSPVPPRSRVCPPSDSAPRSIQMDQEPPSDGTIQRHHDHASTACFTSVPGTVIVATNATLGSFRSEGGAGVEKLHPASAELIRMPASATRVKLRMNRRKEGRERSMFGGGCRKDRCDPCRIHRSSRDFAPTAVACHVLFRQSRVM